MLLCCKVATAATGIENSWASPSCYQITSSTKNLAAWKKGRMMLVTVNAMLFLYLHWGIS